MTGTEILSEPGQSTHGANLPHAAFFLRKQEATMLKRLLFFAYGVASYLTFLVTFLYAIAFVGGFAVPRQLDGPLESSLPF